MDAPELEHYLQEIDKRAPGKDGISYVDDLGVTIKVDPFVWDPFKGKSTKLFLELLNNYSLKKSVQVLEIGTGVGILSIQLFKKGIKNIVATEIDKKAFKNADSNFKKNNVNINLLESDLFDNVYGTFDLIIFNSPAIHPLRTNASNGQISLWSDDVNLMNKFLLSLPKYLKENGRALIMYSCFSDFDSIDSRIREKMKIKFIKKAATGVHSTSGILEVKI